MTPCHGKLTNLRLDASRCCLGYIQDSETAGRAARFAPVSEVNAVIIPLHWCCLGGGPCPVQSLSNP